MPLRAASEIEHKHVVPLLDFGESQGRRYLVMPFVQGRSLEQRLQDEGPLPASVRGVLSERIFLEDVDRQDWLKPWPKLARKPAGRCMRIA